LIWNCLRRSRSGTPVAFGIAGNRKLSGVVGRPLIGITIEPSVGLTPKQTAAIARNLGEAGIDFIKDDELWLTRHHSALKERVRAVMTENQDLPDQTGRKLMYAFDISDNLDAMLEHHDLVPDERGTCTRVSLNSIGLSASSTLRKHAELPIHGRRNGRD
jgi:ribulose-bisphosphate carboxylase large chain